MDLRKVKYHLDEGYKQYTPDTTEQEERHDMEKQGWFHKWTLSPHTNPTNGEEYITDYALIENCETGEMDIVFPTLVKFVDRNSD